MNKIKSIGFTAFVSILFIGLLHIIPINRKQKEKDEFAGNLLDGDLEIRDSLVQNISEEPPFVDEIQNVEPLPPLPSETPKKQEVSAEQPVETVKEETAPPKEPMAKEEVKKEDPKKKEIKKDIVDTKITKTKEPNAAKKETETKKEAVKESKIGVDRKLISGIPGTGSYKGKFPAHNVKEKGSITISYVVDAEGKVISAHRTAGLSSRNAINNAITLVRKYVKAEKGKTKSTGTYTIDFK